MNDDERRLAGFLHRATPQPPHQLAADEIMSLQPMHSGGFRHWPQLAAAAAVVLLGEAPR